MGQVNLLNKILFALAEGKNNTVQRKLRLSGWTVYILGVPAWVIILAGNQDWIAASIEAGGVPAMLFGLWNVYQDKQTVNKKLNRVTALFTYAALLFGVSYSLFDYGGITSLSQLLELGVMVGFLTGSYLLAKRNIYGWTFFMLMNGSMAALMLLQHKPLLAFQQFISFGFVVYGFSVASRNVKKKTCRGH